jgi:hypothetical protein
MKIGIDIDDTVCRGLSDTVPEAMSKEWDYRILHADAISNSIQSIKDLISSEHKIYFISSRYASDRPLTVKWFKKFGIDENDYTLCLRLPETYGPTFKRMLIGALGLDIYIDDKPRLVEIANSLNIDSILFTNWIDVMESIKESVKSKK